MRYLSSVCSKDNLDRKKSYHSFDTHHGRAPDPLALPEYPRPVLTSGGPFLLNVTQNFEHLHMVEERSRVGELSVKVIS
jgi:hypothetical protein